MKAADRPAGDGRRLTRLPGPLRSGRAARASLEGIGRVMRLPPSSAALPSPGRDISNRGPSPSLTVTCSAERGHDRQRPYRCCRSGGRPHHARLHPLPLLPEGGVRIFAVELPTILKGLSAGDRVRFNIEREYRSYVVTRLENSNQGRNPTNVSRLPLPRLRQCRKANPHAGAEAGRTSYRPPCG
jgi:hypothetical protein